MQKELQSLSKNKLKLFQSLKIKKYREEHGLFILEGEKFVMDAIQKFPHRIETLVLEESYHPVFPLEHLSSKCFTAKRSIFNKISSLQNYNKSLAICTIPDSEIHRVSSGLIVLLDRIQDPGNLGTIIRTCDWFGLSEIFALKGTVDCYNPKVVQASSGSVLNVRVHYKTIEDVASLFSKNEFLMLDMSGVPIEDFSLQSSQDYVLVLGNEGQGLDNRLWTLNHRAIAIPGDKNRFTDSLNAAVSFSIALKYLY